MKLLYVLRVVAISAEATIVLAAGVGWLFFSPDIQRMASSIQFDEELVKYLMLVPMGLAIWIVNETRLMLIEDKERLRILTSWPDYWKLKVHAWVGLSYASVFGLCSLIPWATKGSLESGGGLLIFVVTTFGNLIVARGVFAARIRVTEVLEHGKVA